MDAKATHRRPSSGVDRKSVVSYDQPSPPSARLEKNRSKHTGPIDIPHRIVDGNSVRSERNNVGLSKI